MFRAHSDSRRDAGAWSGAPCSKRKTVHVPDVLADPEYTLCEGAEDWPVSAPCSAFRCCAKETRSA